MITYNQTYGNGGVWLGPLILSNKPIHNNIMCPKCGTELLDSEPGTSYETDPPQTPIHCDECGFSSMRFHSNETIDMTSNSGHYCLSCKRYFHNKNEDIAIHLGCMKNNNIGIIFDTKEYETK